MVAGGWSTRKGRTLNANEIYDPATDSWRAGSPMPTSRGGNAAAVVEDRMYVLGGGNAHGPFPNNEIYDIDSDLWTTGRPMTVGRDGLAVVALTGAFTRSAAVRNAVGATARRTRSIRPDRAAIAGQSSHPSALFCAGQDQAPGCKTSM